MKRTEAKRDEAVDNTTFSYTYSASLNKEVQEIRSKYLPREESKLERLKRLDREVASAGMTESLSAGIGGALILGVGMCAGLGAIGGGMVLAVILGVVGAAAMIAAYPVYRNRVKRAKEKYVPEILRLADEISKENR